MKKALREEREHFLTDLATINLRRMWWLTLATTVITTAILLYNLLLIRRPDLLALETLDFAISVTFIVLIGLARARRLGEWWRRNLAVLYLLMMLSMMDAYFFSALSFVGQNSSYVIGTVICGVLLLFPPPLFLSLLLANHVLYCAILLSSGRGATAIAAAITEGSVGVLVAGLASWFLYAAHRGNFRKERIIAQRNRELAASNAGLKQLNEEMNELMAIAAHDLRSPLQGQKNLLELAQSRLSLGREQLARILDAAVDGCTGMLSLVARLLEAHSAEHGNLPLQTVDLKERFASAGKRAQTAAAAKGSRILFEAPVEAVEARCSAEALDQVLDNLLGNAIKFSPPGSTVHLALVRKNGICYGEIGDEGPGVPESERAALFRKFHRGSARPTADEPSTGLGLFIAQKLMQRMNGSVVYVPREPVGSIFRLNFSNSGSVFTL